MTQIEPWICVWIIQYDPNVGWIIHGYPWKGLHQLPLQEALSLLGWLEGLQVQADVVSISAPRCLEWDQLWFTLLRIVDVPWRSGYAKENLRMTLAC